ncbi:glycosyltransferase family 4 protein [Fundidesulfovibrio soli]|uniref:glycosyltransferase family 4 protein n=1 Tax=Fundidesulfovibrio soli TaxID=2922716 RepID=UPI001FAF84D2
MARKLKVIVNAVPLTGVNTGIGRYLRCLCAHIESRHGSEVSLSYFDGRRVLPSMPAPAASVAGRSRLTKLLWSLPPAAALAARLAVHARREWAFYNAAKGFDVYHEAAFFPFLAPKGVRTVFTVHDLSLIRYPQHHPRERVLYFEMFFRRRLKRVSRYLAVSRFTRREMREVLGITEDMVDITYNAVEPEFFRPRPGESLVPGLAPGEKYFFFLGTNDPRKNPQVIPKALAQSGLDTPLALAGWSGWAADAAGPGRVIELGYVPDEALPGLYSGALALVYPSMYEGFGLPVLEAMACGCPVITANAASLPEVGGEACLYLDNPSDPGEMAQAMRRLAHDQDLREALRLRGLEQAAKFRWGDSADAAVAAYFKAAT